MSSGEASGSSIGVAIVDRNIFFATAVTSWLLRHDPRIRITAVLSDWDELSHVPLDNTDVAILDAEAPDELPLPTKVALLRTAHIATICLGTATNPEHLAAIEEVGGTFLLRTEPTPVLLKTIHDLHRHPQTPPVITTATPDAQVVALSAPKLAPQEQRVLALYASGRTVAEVAQIMNLSQHSIVSYIKTIRAKYAAAGLSARTKTALHHRATSAGLL